MSERTKFIAQVAATTTTFITGVVGLVRAFPDAIPWAVVLIAVVVLAAGLNILVAWDVYRTNKAARYKVEDVEGYLREIIASSSSGKTAIFTHRMSWVKTDATREVLRAKAREGNLKIFTPSDRAFFTELASLGAEVHYYSQAVNHIQTSFTVTQHDERNAMVYVGLPEDDNKHIKIDKFKMRDHPTAWLARDVQHILTSVGVLVR